MKKTIILITFLLLSLQQSIVWSATISGTLFQGNSTDPIEDIDHIMVAITDYPLSEGCQGTLCVSYVHPPAAINNDGTFVFNYVEPGSYIISAYSVNGGNYLMEWWDDPVSTRNINDAKVVNVVEDDNITNINFNLDPGGIITGHVFKSDGTLLNDRPIGIRIYTIDDSGTISTIAVPRENITLSYGIFTIPSIPTGHYYIEAFVYGSVDLHDIEYTQEWWASDGSSINLSNAEQIFIYEGEQLINRDFQLDPLITIRGKIYYDDGATLDYNDKEHVEIIATKNNCGSFIDSGDTAFNDDDGNYAILGINSGTYFLVAVGVNGSRIVPTWWNASGGTTNCINAEPVVLNGSENIFNKDFKIKFLKPFPWQLILPSLHKNNEIKKM